MKLRAEQLAAQLQRATTLAPLWLVHGDDALLVLEAADRIRAAAREQGFGERDTLIVGHGFRWDALALAAGNLSLFGGAKLIDLRIPNGKPGRDGGEALQRHARALPAHMRKVGGFDEPCQVAPNLDQRDPGRHQHRVGREQAVGNIGIRFVDIALQQRTGVDVGGHSPRSSASTSATRRRPWARRTGGRPSARSAGRSQPCSTPSVI